ncbi:MAG: riboflavin kinase [Candidatus Yonathbacteria bacterium]|nr:riboflavin kinase [Candidatus Yonathbacteria bacterium]
MIVMTARVIHGLRRGKNLGFPTANVRHRIGQAPPDGIYAAWAFMNRQWYRAAVSVGRNRTFGASHATIEAHLLDWHGIAYGRILTLIFAHRIRSMRRFTTANDLASAIRRDIQNIKNILVPRCGRSGVS